MGRDEMAGRVDKTHHDPFEVSDPAACIVSLLSRYIGLPLSISHDEYSIPCMQVSTAAKVQSKRSAIVPFPPTWFLSLLDLESLLLLFARIQ